MVNLNNDNIRALAILDAREQRAELLQELINKYKKTLIATRINYPGLYKDNEITRSIMKIIVIEICDNFDEVIVYERLEYTAEGPCFFLIVDMEPLKVKSKTMEIEDSHPLGRLADIDVYNSDGASLSRTELGLSQRKCYLCGDTAHNCVRSRKHSGEEVIYYIDNQYKKYKEC